MSYMNGPLCEKERHFEAEAIYHCGKARESAARGREITRSPPLDHYRTEESTRRKVPKETFDVYPKLKCSLGNSNSRSLAHL